MRKLNDKELENIIGGSISSSIINAFTNVIKVIQSAGNEFGSALRRIVEGNMCPLS